MTERVALVSLLAWAISVPSMTWAMLGGPLLATVVGYTTFAVGLIAFFWWANTGGWPAPQFLR